MAYLGVVVSPLVFAVIGASQPDHGFWTNFSVALGFVGLAMMGLEFVLVARFRPVAAPFGQDALLQFHRQIGYVGLAFVLTHVAISAKWNELTLANALAAPLLVWFGMAAVLSLIVLIATSVWRRRLRVSYEAWHIVHGALAVVAVGGALGHVFFVDEYVHALEADPVGAHVGRLRRPARLGASDQASRRADAPLAPGAGRRRAR
jgi:predicted ferric reductase